MKRKSWCRLLIFFCLTAFDVDLISFLRTLKLEKLIFVPVDIVTGFKSMLHLKEKINKH